MPTDRQPRRSLAFWLVPLAAFVVGAVVALTFAPVPTPEPAAPETPVFGASTPEAAPTPAENALRSELALMRDINENFVEQLRRYDDRLEAIAVTAEEEGAPESAAAMRDFALETKLLIERYNKISKQN